MEIINQTNILNLPTELIELIIINCTPITKFIMHFVSKYFWNITMDNKKIS